MTAHLAPDLQGGEAAIARWIPYRNWAALVAYYLGLFSVGGLFPVVGVVGVGMAVTAVVLGWKGRRVVRQHPEARGGVHAYVGIVCGVVFGLLGALVQVWTALYWLNR